MRPLFSDGFNSASHFGFGVLAAVWQPLLISAGFMLYQLSEQDQTNTLVDISEFAIGFIATKLMS